MYRRRRERRQHIINNIIRWYPAVLILVMFVLGACSRLTAASTESLLQTTAQQISEETTERISQLESESNQSGSIPTSSSTSEITVVEQGNYTSKDEVALYLHLFGHLPSNYITKKQAEEQGWNSKDGNLSDVLPGMSIGGSHFGNYEKMLPTADGRKYYECDIDYTGGYRGAKRIIWSNDGLIYYTEDHYETFEQLY